MAKRTAALVRRLDMRVTLEDGATVDYSSLPIDIWRVEKVTGKPVKDALDTYEGIAVLAWSCALRAGHANRPGKGQTDLAAFERWLEMIVSVDMLEDDEEAKGEDPTSGDASPER